MPENGLHAFQRNHYFYGKLLTVRDFEMEQSYFNDKRHLLNRLLHGTGIVCGLHAAKSGLRGLSVSPGVAIDCDGREIIAVKEQLRTDIREMDGYPEAGGAKTLYLMLHYDERAIETVPSLGEASSCEGSCEANRIQEELRLSWTTEAPKPDVSLQSVLHGSTVLYEDAKIRVERIVPRWINPGDAFEVTIRATAMQSLADENIEIIASEQFGEHFTKISSELMSIVLGNVAKGTVRERRYYLKASADGTEGAGAIIAGNLSVLNAGNHHVVETPLTAIVFGSHGALNERVIRYFAETEETTWACLSDGVTLAAVTVDDNDEITGVFDSVRRYVYNNPLLQKLLIEEDGAVGKLLPHSLSHAADGYDPINVNGLFGLLADPQWVVAYTQGDEYVEARRFSFVGPGVTVQKSPDLDDHVIVGIATAPHAPQHMSGGDDPLDVTNLSGKLADPQKVAVSLGGSSFSAESLEFSGSLTVKAAGNKAQIIGTDTRGVQVFNGTDYAWANKLRFLGEGVKISREGELTDVTLSNAPQSVGAVLTGTIIFYNVGGGEKRSSHWLEDAGVTPSVTFGVDIVDGDHASVGVAGQLALGMADAPEVASIYKPYAPGFMIVLRDRREAGAVPVTWRIRWWAAPVGKDYGDVAADAGDAWFTELIIARLIVAPGQTVFDLTKIFNEPEDAVQKTLNMLEEAKRIVKDEYGYYRINPFINEK